LLLLPELMVLTYKHNRRQKTLFQGKYATCTYVGNVEELCNR